METGEKLRLAFISQKGRINSNFLDQAGLMEKFFFYVGFNSPKEDFRRANEGINATTEPAMSLTDIKDILARYRSNIGAFQVFPWFNIQN